MGDLTEHFSRHEFACRCGCGFENIDMNLVAILENIRNALRSPIIITSGCRCEKHNEKAGGKPDSSHLKGKAVDIFIRDSCERFKCVAMAIEGDVKRVGIAKNFIHLDIDGSKPQKVLWLY